MFIDMFPVDPLFKWISFWHMFYINMTNNPKILAIFPGWMWLMETAVSMCFEFPHGLSSCSCCSIQIIKIMYKTQGGGLDFYWILCACVAWAIDTFLFISGWCPVAFKIFLCLKETKKKKIAAGTVCMKYECVEYFHPAWNTSSISLVWWIN